MPPRKSKGKNAAAEPKGRRSTRASKAAAQADPEPPVVDAPSETPPSQVVQESLPSTVSETAESVPNAPEHTVTLVAHEEPPPQPYEPMPVDEPESSNLSSPPVEPVDPVDPVPDVETSATDAVTVVSPPTPPPSLTMEQRQAKLEALRIRMVCFMSSKSIM
jgi:large repetitive protein